METILPAVGSSRTRVVQTDNDFAQGDGHTTRAYDGAGIGWTGPAPRRCRPCRFDEELGHVALVDKDAVDQRALVSSSLYEIAAALVEPAGAVIVDHHGQLQALQTRLRPDIRLVATVEDGADTPGEEGIELQWRTTRAAWPASPGTRLLAQAWAAAI